MEQPIPKQKVPLLTPEALVKARIKACQDEILASLKKHNCLLDASVTISRDQIEPVVRIVAIKDEDKLDIKKKTDTLS